MIRYAGFRWVRGGIEGLTDRGPTTLQTYLDLHRATGVRFSWGLGSGGTDVGKLVATARTIAAAGALLAFEGNNEPNNWGVTYRGEQGGGDDERQRGGQPVHGGTHQHEPWQGHGGEHPLLERPVLRVGAEQAVEREQPGEQHGEPQHCARRARQHLRLATQREREQHHDEHGEHRRLQRIAAAAPEQAQVAQGERAGRLDQPGAGRPAHAALPSSIRRVRTGGAA